MLTKNFQITERCPHCNKVYTLGVDGIEGGCDQCLGIVRNPLDGTIVFDFNKDFEKAFTDDEVTDMENT